MDRRVAVVVEDDEDIRELMAAVLSQSGFAVHEAGTGAAGVAAVREHEPVVVTVDLGLPDTRSPARCGSSPTPTW